MDPSTAAVTLMPVARAAKRVLDAAAGLTPTQAAYLKKLQAMVRAAMQTGMDARQAGLVREQMVVTYNHFKRARQADKKALAAAAASAGKALMGLSTAPSVPVTSAPASPKMPSVPVTGERRPARSPEARGTCPPGSPPPGKVCVRGFWKWRNAAARRSLEQPPGVSQM